MRLSEDSGAIAGGVEPSHGSFNDSTDNLKDNCSNGDQVDISLKVLTGHIITRINLSLGLTRYIYFPDSRVLDSMDYL